jgi:uncharacterized protein (DUF2147 family)
MTSLKSRLLLIALCMAAAVPATAAEYPNEFWVNPDQGWVVETKPCDSGLCGYLVGYRADAPHPAGYIPKDVHNPDPKHRDEPLCGLMLMGGFNPANETASKWENGWIYDPDSGKTYSGTISLVDRETVKLRGYVGIALFGRTMMLHREATPPETCSALPTNQPAG